jgi:hypothetical protein
MKSGHRLFPLQHPLKEVLHFVCELRGPTATHHDCLIPPGNAAATANALSPSPA